MSMIVSITGKFIDEITAPANKAKAAIEGLAKAAGSTATQAAQAATAKVEAATKAATDKARDAGKQAADKAVATAKDAGKAKVPPSTIGFLREQGLARQPEPPPLPKPASPKGGGKLGFADLSGLPAEADKAASRSVGLVGQAVATAKDRVAVAISQELGARLSGIATDMIAEKTQAALDPLRANLESLKERFPALSGAIDGVGTHLESLAMLASSVVGEAAGRAAGAIATRVGAMAAALIGWPGLIIAGAVAVMAKWSSVKDFFAGLFARLPAPVQAAMSRIGAILSATPLGALARGFDAFASYVETVFAVLFSKAEDKWEQLKQLLIGNPMDWISGAWDGLKSYFSSLWDSIKANPRAAFANMANTIVTELKAIPSRVMNIGIDILEALTGADLSGVRQLAQSIIDTILDIPNRLANLGADILGKISQGDWRGAAETAIRAYLDGLMTILGWVADLGLRIADAFKIDLAEIGRAAIMSLKAGFEAAWGMVSDWVDGKVTALKNKFSNIIPSFGGGGAPGGGSGPGLQKRARGGSVRGGTPYIVGEEGQELFIPDGDGTIIDAGRTRQALAPSLFPASSAAPSLYGSGGQAGGSTTIGGNTRQTQVYNTFHLTMQGAKTDDPEDFGRKLWAEVEKQTRGLMHDGVDA